MSPDVSSSVQGQQILGGGQCPLDLLGGAPASVSKEELMAETGFCGLWSGYLIVSPFLERSYNLSEMNISVSDQIDEGNEFSVGESISAYSVFESTDNRTKFNESVCSVFGRQTVVSVAVSENEL